MMWTWVVLWAATIAAAYGLGYWLASPSYDLPDWLLVILGFATFAAGVGLVFAGWVTLTAGL